MIYTSYFAKQARNNDPNTAYASVAVGLPKYPLAHELKHLTSVKPYGVFGKYHGEEYKQKYFERLEMIGLERIYNELMSVQGDKENLILMCYEKDPSECHRRMFAEWWYKKTGEIIEEI